MRNHTTTNQSNEESSKYDYHNIMKYGTPFVLVVLLSVMKLTDTESQIWLVLFCLNLLVSLLLIREWMRDVMHN